MSADTQRLIAAGVAIGASVASAFVPDSVAAETLRHITTLVLGWFFLRRPGDLSALAHPNDLPERKR